MATPRNREDLEAFEEQNQEPESGMRAITVDEKADKLKEEVKLPASPGRNISFDKMAEWLALLNESQWQYITIYMYRIWPKIMREQDPANIDPDTGDAIKYIDCFGGPFTRDDIVQMHGGGKYDFWVKDTGSGPKRTTLFKAKLDVPTEEADPVINPAELDWEARVNLAYVQKLRALGKARGKEFINPAIAAVSGDHAMMEKMFNYIVGMSENERQHLRERNPDNAFIEEAIKMASKANEKPLEFMMEQMKSVQRESPSDYMKATAALIEAVRPKEYPPSNDNTLFIAMMNNQMEMMKMAIQQQQHPKESDSDDVDKLTKLINLAQMMKGGGRVTEGGWIDKAIEHGLPVLGKVADIVANAMALRRQGIRPGGVRNPAVAGPQPVPTRTGIPQGWSQRAQMRGVPEQQEVVQPEVTPEQEFILGYGNTILQHMGGSGYDFAAMLCEFLAGDGPAAIINIKRIGQEKMLAAMKSIPDFWQLAMANYEEAHVQNFIKEFWEFDPYAPEEEVIDNG